MKPNCRVAKPSLRTSGWKKSFGGLSIAPLLLSLLVGIVCLSVTVRADVLDTLKSYAKDPAKGFLDDAETKAKNVIARGQDAADGAITHAGQVIDVAARDAIIGLGAHINKAIGDLDLGEQNVLASILDLETKADHILAGVYDLRDTTAVDLTNILRGVVFVHAPDFLVQAIKGTALLPQKDDYHITVTAVGFGQTSDSMAEITASLNGNPIKLGEVDQVSEAGNAILSIPNGTILRLFAPDSLKFADLALNVNIKRKHWYWFGWKSHHYQVPIRLMLYPTHVATVTVHFTAPSFGWVSTGDVFSATKQTEEKDGCKFCDVSCTSKPTFDVTVPGNHTPTAVGDERITKAGVECIAGGSICAFNVRSGTDISANGTRASGHVETCSHPTVWRLRASVERWQQTGDPTNDQKIEVLVDRPQVIPLPDGVSSVTIDVVSSTKQNYTFVIPSSDPHGILNATMPPGSHSLIISALPIQPIY